MKRRLVAAIAVRNQGSRLYGKPLQNLDYEHGIKIIDNIIACLNSLEEIDEVILGISEGTDNLAFQEYAKEIGLRYIIGDEIDVLDRLIKCGELGGASDIFRMTSESPFLFFEAVPEVWDTYKSKNYDALFYDKIIDGCGFEIISLEALKRSHKNGDDRHRSELCTLYIRENKDKFNIKIEVPDDKFIRTDLRLTVDYPEDLILCRYVYNKFKENAPKIPLDEVIQFLDQNEFLKKLISPYTEGGYNLMYK
jgi:spore coat polysaccharide biosynthesis protein SpsF